MVSCPIMLVGWVVVQNIGPGGGGVAAIGARFRTIAFENLPKAAPVAVTLACSGFIGVAAAALIPGGEVASALGFDAMPDFVLLGLIPIALTCMSLLALSPIMMAVLRSPAALSMS